MHVLVLAAEEITYPECTGVCAAMGNQWRMPNMADFGWYSNPIPEGDAWINELDWRNNLIFSGTSEFRPLLRNNWGVNFGGNSNIPTNGLWCYCATQERPKVKYSYCEGVDIRACSDVKVADGWYPLGVMAAYHLVPDGIGYQTGYVNPSSSTFKQMVQAFWRWAE